MKGTSLLYGSLLAAALLASTTGANAAPLACAAALSTAADEVGLDVQARARGGGARVSVGRVGGTAVRRTTVVRPGGGAAVRRTTVVRPGGAAVVRTGAWVRPGYRWRRGGAIAAGAAIGFVAAATAASWAGAAPCPNCCWYYTDPSRTQGFWDYCP